jgi:DNA-binding transcriptional LysR family regulator
MSMDVLDRLDLNWLRALAYILEERSVTAAARRAGVGQPAMSRTLAHLRTLLGDPLLVRVGGRSELSERAQALAPRVQAALAAVRAVLSEPAVFDHRTSHFEARVAATDYAGATLLIPWLMATRQRAPRFVLRTEPVGLESVARLASGEIDFALGSRMDAPHLGIDQLVVRELWKDRFVCAMRKGHPRAKGRWDLETFLDLEHVIVTVGAPGLSAVDTALSKRRRSRRVGATVSSFLLAPLVLEGSDMLATLPRRLLPICRASGIVERRPPLELPDAALYVAWHPRSNADVRHRWLRESLLAHASAR